MKFKILWDDRNKAKKQIHNWKMRWNLRYYKMIDKQGREIVSTTGFLNILSCLIKECTMYLKCEV